jgi:hypothetical protein
MTSQTEGCGLYFASLVASWGVYRDSERREGRRHLRAWKGKTWYERPRKVWKPRGSAKARISYSFRRRPMFSATTTCDPSIDRDHNLWYFSASLQLSQLVIPPSTGATTCDILHIPTRITTCDILLCKDHNLWSLHNKITTCGCSPVESHLPIGPGSAHRNFILSETFTEREYCIAHHYETRYFTLCSNNENTNRVCYPSNMHLLKRYRTETFYIG